MKKVKIMLLSLALFAVIGAALAFKVKLGTNKFCYADAYFDELSSPQYYCSFDQGGGVFITKQCDVIAINCKIGTGVLKVCTTQTFGARNDAECQLHTCPVITSITFD
jgi:hypothetical protein